MNESHSKADHGLVYVGLPKWIASARPLIVRYAQHLERRSTAVPLYFERNMVPVMAAWAVVFGLVCALRAAFPATPYHSAADMVPVALQYGAIILAPVAGYFAASGSFPRGTSFAQPQIRLCRYGKWRALSQLEARDAVKFGPSGYMASLLVGLLLNVVVRSFEFILAMPAIGPSAPGWANTLSLVMSADVAVMGFFYSVCFVLALRGSPYFPRLLLFAWLLDINIQMSIGRIMAAAEHLPAAVSDPLRALLVGNLYKVFISIAVWLPYLILSDRVNRTYRMRVRQVSAA